MLVVLICGVRAGKSWLASCAAIHSALTCPMTKGGRKLKRHEVARFAIVGPDVDCAAATFVILRGIIESSPVLARMLDGEPTADSLVIRRSDGYRIESASLPHRRAAARSETAGCAGSSSRRSPSSGTDATGAAVSAEEMLRAGRTRLLDLCQGWLILSPYGPQGLLHDLWRKLFGKPGSTLVVHAGTRDMNPSFPQEPIDKLAAVDPDAADREHYAKFLDSDLAYLVTTLIDAGGKGPLVRRRPDGATCFAAGDFATRGNAWTWVVGCIELHGEDSRVAVLGAWEEVGSKKAPLSPKAMCREMARTLRPYGVTEIHCDRWSYD